MSFKEHSLNNRFARGITIFICGVVFTIGLAAWFHFISSDSSSRAWRALLVNFIFFTPLAAGMLVWPAVAIISQGLWGRSIERSAFGALAFAPFTVIVLLALWYSNSHTAIFWADKPTGLLAKWLNLNFLFARDLVAIAIVWILAALFVFKSRQNLPKVLGGWLSFVYAIAFTLLGFDLVMSLDPHWFSTLFGWYFVMSGMYAALAAWTFFAVLNNSATIDQRHDLGKLLVALSLVTTYMMYSQLLPIWYENLPEEVRFVIPRLSVSNWQYISAALLAIIYLGPLILLLTRWSKRNRCFLASICILILAGLWVERWWLIMPTLKGHPSFGLIELSVTAAFLAAFIICYLFGYQFMYKKEVADEQ